MGGKLLVVDDSRASARLIAASMREHGYDVEVAHSGADALAVLAREPIDCVLLDMVMPGMSGEETCRAIRGDRLFSSVSVIIVTGRDGDYTTATIDAGADDYVVKSSDLRPLAARVRAQLRRRALEQENARMALFELESRRKTAFLATIAHELRTPLNAVAGFSALLGEESLTDVQRMYVEQILGGTHDLQRIVERVAQFAELDRGTLVLQRAPSDVDAIARAVGDALRSIERARATDVRLEVEAAAPPVLVDRVRLEQVLIGLGSNAIKFSSRGTEVLLRARARGDSVEFGIEDHGIGIAAADLPRLLHGHEQLGEVMNKKPGLGIGLAASKRLIELHGGTMDIRSELGRGTTVTFSVPVAR